MRWGMRHETGGRLYLMNIATNEMMPAMLHRCLVCNNEVKQLPYVNEHFQFLNRSGRNVFKGLTILADNNCGFGHAFPFLKEADLDKFYKDDYASEGRPHYEYIEI